MRKLRYAMPIRIAMPAIAAPIPIPAFAPVDKLPSGRSCSVGTGVELPVGEEVAIADELEGDAALLDVCAPELLVVVDTIPPVARSTTTVDGIGKVENIVTVGEPTTGAILLPYAGLSLRTANAPRLDSAVANPKRPLRR